MLKFLSIGLFLMSKKPLVVKTDKLCLFIEDFGIMYNKSNTLQELSMLRSILEFYLKDLGIISYNVLKEKLTDREIQIKNLSNKF